MTNTRNFIYLDSLSKKIKRDVMLTTSNISSCNLELLTTCFVFLFQG